MGALIKEVADRERYGHDYLVEVAIAGLKYARALTQTDSFSVARSSKAHSALLDAVTWYTHQREKENPAAPAHRSVPMTPGSEAAFGAFIYDLRKPRR